MLDSHIAPWWEGPLPDAPSARIIADSVSTYGHRITTFEMRMHRFVLAELNTHTLFSRNSASSRAIPYRKQRKRLLESPAIPVVWPAEKPGMQGGNELELQDQIVARHQWLAARDVVVQIADSLALFLEPEVEERIAADLPYPDGASSEKIEKIDALRDALRRQILSERYHELNPSEAVHKSLVNRLLEPWMWHTATVTAVDWEGFFLQRSSLHTDMAQPELAAVATQVEELYRESTPRVLNRGEWHTPYIRDPEYIEFPDHEIRQLSVARCARTSYLTHDGDRNPAEDFKLYNRLENPGGGPPHASPFQHVATPDPSNESVFTIDPARYGLIGDTHEMRVPVVGNARGWMQLRHIVLGF